MLSPLGLPLQALFRDSPQLFLIRCAMRSVPAGRRTGSLFPEFTNLRFPRRSI